MALVLASVFIGFLWGIGLLAVAERLVAWRWPANKRNRKEDNKKRKKGTPPPQGRRVSPGAFLVAAGGTIAGSLVVADVALDIVSAIMAAPANVPTFVPFVVGAAGALLLRRDRLPPVLYAAGVALREFLVERATAQQQAPPPDPVGRRFREPVSSVIDAPVTPVIRTLPPAVAGQPGLPPIMVTIPAPRRSEPTLAQRRREIVSHLEARAAALAAMAPRAPEILPPAEPAAALASQAAATIAETRALHEIWQAEAAAQREQWRQAGESQRAQWRREAQALGRAWDKPPGNAT